MDAPTGLEGVVPRPGTWAKTGLPASRIRPLRRKQTSMAPGRIVCEVRVSGLDRREWGGTGMEGIIQKGSRAC